MFILKGVKVLCFDTLLQVFILKLLRLGLHLCGANSSVLEKASGSKKAPVESSGKPEVTDFVVEARLKLVRERPQGQKAPLSYRSSSLGSSLIMRKSKSATLGWRGAQ